MHRREKPIKTKYRWCLTPRSTKRDHFHLRGTAARQWHRKSQKRFFNNLKMHENNFNRKGHNLKLFLIQEGSGRHLQKECFPHEIKKGLTLPEGA
jgi:hypothetical protein